MTWTSEPPTSPGIFYWRAGKGSEVKTVVLAYTKGTTAYTPELFVVYPQNDHTPVQYARDMGGQWGQFKERGTPMKWTSDKPKKIGWYWNRPEKDFIPRMVFVCWRYAPNRPPRWCAIVPCECDKWIDVNTVAGEWAGPIPEPTEEEA